MKWWSSDKGLIVAKEVRFQISFWIFIIVSNMIKNNDDDDDDDDVAHLIMNKYITSPSFDNPWLV